MSNPRPNDRVQFLAALGWLDRARRFGVELLRTILPYAAIAILIFVVVGIITRSIPLGTLSPVSLLASGKIRARFHSGHSAASEGGVRGDLSRYAQDD